MSQVPRVLLVWAIRGGTLAVSAVLALSACGDGTKIGTQNNCSTGADCAGRDHNDEAGQGKSTEPPGSSASAEPVAPTTTPTSTQADAKPLAVGELNFTGDNWVQGTWTLKGRKYEKSLAWVQACNGQEEVVIQLPRAYQHFTAEVGFAEGEDGRHEYTTDFDLWADRNQDGESDSNELIASRGATFDKSATISADDLRGASQIILAIRTDDCIAPPLVWGSPQVS